MKDKNIPESQSNRTFSLWQLLCFGVLTTPLAMGGFAFVVFVPTYYAIDLGLGLGVVGAVIVAGRLFDVITDPLIGHLSDETRTRFGPRKPWIVAGVPAFSLAAWMLLAPPEDVGLWYLAVASGVYFLCYTALDVPYSSIGLEISPHVHERSLLASSKGIFQVVGALTVAAIPVTLTLGTADALSLTARIIAALCVLGLFAFLAFVPNTHRVVKAPSIGFWQAFKFIAANGAYKRLVGCFLIIQSANALTAGLSVLFITHAIKRPDLIGAFMGVLLASSAVFLPVLVTISKRFGKLATWQAGIMACCLLLATTPFLGEGDVTAMLILSAIIGAAFGCDAIMPTSMLADIVYAGEQAGENRFAGLYLAVKNSVSKLAFVVPMGLAFPVLDLVDFAETGTNSTTQTSVLVFFYAGLPIILRLVALYILRRPWLTKSPIQ